MKELDAFNMLNSMIDEEEKQRQSQAYDPIQMLDEMIIKEEISTLETGMRTQQTEPDRQGYDLLDTITDYAYSGFNTIKNSLSQASKSAEADLYRGVQPIKGKEGFNFNKDKALQDINTVLDAAPLAARIGAGVGTGMTGWGLLGSAAAAESAGLITEAATSSIKEYLDLSPDENETLPDFIAKVQSQGITGPDAQAMIQNKVRESGKNFAYDLAFGGAFTAAGMAASYAAGKGKMLYDVMKSSKAASKAERFKKIDAYVDTQLKPATEAARLADELGVSQNAATAGKSATIETLASLPSSQPVVKKYAEQAVKELDDLTAREISFIAEPKSSAEITESLSKFMKDTELVEASSVLPVKSSIKKGYEIGYKMKDATKNFTSERGKLIKKAYEDAKSVLPKDVGVLPSNTLKKIDEFLQDIPANSRTPKVSEGFQTRDLIDKQILKLKEEIELTQATGEPINIMSWSKFRSHLNDIAYRGGEDTNVKQVKAIAQQMLDDEKMFVRKLVDSGNMTPEAQEKLISARKLFQETAEKNELISGISNSASGQKAFDVVRGFDPEQLKTFKTVLDEVDPKAFPEYRDHNFHKLAVNPSNPDEYGIEHFVKNYSKMKESGYADVLFSDSPVAKKEYDRLLDNFNKLNKGKALTDANRGSGLDKLKLMGTSNLKDFTSMLQKHNPELYSETVASLLKDIGTDKGGKFSGITFAKNFDQLDHDNLIRDLVPDSAVQKLRKISTLIQANESNYNIALDTISQRYGQILSYVRGMYTTSRVVAPVLGLASGGVTGAAGAGVLSEVSIQMGPRMLAKLYSNPTYVRWINSVLETPNPSKKQISMMMGRLMGMAAADENLKYSLQEFFQMESEMDRYFQYRLYKQGENKATNFQNQMPQTQNMQR